MSTSPSDSSSSPQAGPSSLAQAELSPIDLKKDGSASKMRMHKGNLPSIPQNKLCPLCPAKFTRTTHLNRHLRTHSGERMHECIKCRSQFTRSDLLTRHKRTCGDLENAPRSRRRSCQSCAESKVKCDLQQPCTKCRARNRDCVYAGGHSVAAGAPLPPRRMSSPHDTASAWSMLKPASPLRSSSSSSSSTPSFDNSSLTDAELIQALISNGYPTTSAPVSFDAPAASVDFAIESMSTFARIDRPDLFPQTEQNQQQSMFCGGMFPELFESIFEPTQQRQKPAAVAEEMHSGKKFTLPPAMSSDLLAGVHEIVNPNGMFVSPNPLEDLWTSFAPTPDLIVPTAVSDSNASAAETSASGALKERQPFQHDLYLFFSIFTKMLPIVHSTFMVTGKPEVLMTAMRACGSLYMKTSAAAEFINDALASARDELVAELAQNQEDWEHQVHLTLAVVLLQTIGLFHQLPEQRASSTVYHGMLAMLIRMNGFVEHCASWAPPKNIDAASAEAAWRDWVSHETAKRALLLLWSHDCYHCIFFDLRPTFPADEFDVGLPCEDALWAAPSAAAWLAVLQQPSRYGGRTERLAGRPLRGTVAALAGPPCDTPVLNPYAHFVVVHALLRRLFEAFLDAQPLGAEQLRAEQRALQRWLESWLGSPDAPAADGGADAPFLFQGLPYYWLAQVAILAFEEGLPPFRRGGGGDAKFRTVKKWERHIRWFLRRGQEPTLFMFELMKTRVESAVEEAVRGDTAGMQSASAETQDNLMGFFP